MTELPSASEQEPQRENRHPAVTRTFAAIISVTVTLLASFAAYKFLAFDREKLKDSQKQRDL